MLRYLLQTKTSHKTLSAMDQMKATMALWDLGFMMNEIHEKVVANITKEAFKV